MDRFSEQLFSFEDLEQFRQTIGYPGARGRVCFELLVAHISANKSLQESYTKRLY